MGDIALRDLKPDLSLREFTDNDVLNMTFAVEDPREEFSLSGKIPDGASISHIVRAYDYEHERLPCSVPGCSARHNRGFVIELNDGSHSIVGHVCGKNRFDVAWQDQVDRWKDLSSRRRDLMRRNILASALDAEAVAFIRGLRGLLASLYSSRKQFSDAAPILVKHLRSQIARGTVILTVDEKIDSKLLSIMKAEGKAGPSSIRQRTIHMLDGPQFLVADLDKSQFDSLVGLIPMIEQELRRSETSKSDRTKPLREMRKIVDRCSEVITRCEEAHSFFSIENFEGIAEWSDLLGYERINISRGRILVMPPDAEAVEVGLLQKIPSRTIIEKISDALTKACGH